MPGPSAANPTVLVVFGATGDLMERKIAPSLYHLHEKGRLPERFRVVAFARRDLGDDVFRELFCGSVRRHHAAEVSEADVHAFASAVTYSQGHFDEPGAYARLAEVLASIDADWGVCANKVFYLAAPPDNYEAIIGNLSASGLAAGCPASTSESGWTRVIVEKPFGHDSASARALDALLHEAFEERQIYRIDHYLAKEMLQGVMSFRFSNNLLERSWDNGAIERIEIDLLETLGAEARGAFYDSVGALRDVGQNHLLQMLGLITMVQPADMSADEIRAARAEALEALRPPSRPELPARSFRAQYDGYRSIPGVAPDSETETFFEVVAELDSERWRGVPVVMRAGKRLAEPRKRIVVTFRHPQPCLCDGVSHVENRVTFQLEPADAITITFWTKRPGFEDRLEERDFNFFLYEKEEKTQYVEEYAKLIADIIDGDQTLFVSEREVAAMWAFTDPVVRGWRDGLVPLAHYAPDTDDVLDAAAVIEEPSEPAFPARGEIGVVGLGRMGAALARNLLDHRWRVVGFNRTTSVADALAADGLIPAHTLGELATRLSPPRTVWMMVPAGHVVDEMLFGAGGLASVLEPGDAIVEGGNSRYTDDLARAERLAALGIRFVDAGVSGGPGGARSGACLMIGGDRADFDRLEQLWRDVSVPGGYLHFPGVGAGHFVKMVHNGIEYGMMQSIAEGFAVLKASPYGIDLVDAATIYARGSVIESRLVDWTIAALREHGESLDGVSGTVHHTGEGEWTIETAEALEVDVPVIDASLEFRIASEENPSWTGRLLSALREQFGHHHVT